MDNLRRTVLCKRSRKEKNRITRKTKGRAEDKGGREGEGEPTTWLNVDRLSSG